ncbi:MAG: transcriptional repressor [Acidimicrobiales bacterium]
MAGTDLASILELLSNNGHRITTPRRQIAEAMLALPDHFTPADLADAVKVDHPEIAESTIYRFLDTLSELDVVEHGHIAHGSAVYHVQPVADHVHLVCVQCSSITEAPTAEFDAATRELRERFGFTPRPRHFALEGICSACVDDGSA